MAAIGQLDIMRIRQALGKEPAKCRRGCGVEFAADHKRRVRDRRQTVCEGSLGEAAAGGDERLGFRLQEDAPPFFHYLWMRFQIGGMEDPLGGNLCNRAEALRLDLPGHDFESLTAL